MTPGIREAVMESVLVDLIRAITESSNMTGMHMAVQDAIDALGYDPTEPEVVEEEYEVSLILSVYSTDAEGAVKEFIKMASEKPLDQTNWIYAVKNLETGEDSYVDSYNWSQRKEV